MAHLQKIVPEKLPRKAREKKKVKEIDPPDLGDEVSKDSEHVALN